MKKTNIVFMGTPAFSVPALKALAAQDNFTVSLVVTQPDRPRGRGKILAPSPVKTAALNLGLELCADLFRVKTVGSQLPPQFLFSWQVAGTVCEPFDRSGQGSPVCEVQVDSNRKFRVFYLFYCRVER